MSTVTDFNAMEELYRSAEQLCEIVQLKKTTTLPVCRSDLDIVVLPSRLSHPNMADHTARYQSFKSFPFALRKLIPDLVKYGFFYIGLSDVTVCYVCSVTMHEWVTTDNVLLDHSLESPDCYFSKLYCKNAEQKSPRQTDKSKPVEDVGLTSKPTAKQGFKVEETRGENAVPKKRRRVICREDQCTMTDDGLHLLSNCSICFESKIEVVFLKCGHTSCNVCLTKLTTSTDHMPKCHICRENIPAVKTIFL